MQDSLSLIKEMDGRLRRAEDRNVSWLAAAVRELSDYVKKYCKSSFTVKGLPRYTKR